MMHIPRDLADLRFRNGSGACLAGNLHVLVSPTQSHTNISVVEIVFPEHPYLSHTRENRDEQVYAHENQQVRAQKNACKDQQQKEDKLKPKNIQIAPDGGAGNCISEVFAEVITSDKGQI